MGWTLVLVPLFTALLLWFTVWAERAIVPETDVHAATEPSTDPFVVDRSVA